MDSISITVQHAGQDVAEPLGLTLAALMRARGLNGPRVALLLRVSYPTVKNWLRGRFAPCELARPALCRLLDVSAADLEAAIRCTARAERSLQQQSGGRDREQLTAQQAAELERLRAGSR